MAVYAAQIHCVDYNVGKLVGTLQKLGKLDNTLLFFLSDNGGCAEPYTDHGGQEFEKINDPRISGNVSYGQGWANASNTPFRLYKQRVHEGGIATPLIAHWPAGLGAAPGALSDAPGHVVDVMPTLLELAGASHPRARGGRPSRELRGESLVPVLRGGGRERGPIFWEHQGNRAVRQGRWKLVSRWRRDWELYDMEGDRTELRNLAAEHPGRVRELVALYEEWAENAGVGSWPWVIRPLRRGVAALCVAGLAAGALLFTWMRCHRRPQ